MGTEAKRLPYGIGRFSAGLYLLIVILLAVIALGIYAFSRQLSEGLIVTGMRDLGTMAGATWGLYITFDIYFVGLSFAGIIVVVMIRLLNLTNLKPISRMAKLLMVTSLVMVGLSPRGSLSYFHPKHTAHCCLIASVPIHPNGSSIVSSWGLLLWGYYSTLCL